MNENKTIPILSTHFVSWNHSKLTIIQNWRVAKIGRAVDLKCATVQCLKVPEHGVVIFGYFVYSTFISFQNMTKFCWLLNKSVFSHEWVQNSQTWQNIQANIPGGRAVNTSKFIVNFMSNKLLPNRKAHLRARITWTHHFFFVRNSMYSKVSGIFQWQIDFFAFGRKIRKLNRVKSDVSDS